MFKETEIPDYAMQPAKELKVYPCQGIFNEKEYNCLSERQTQNCIFEEDILVPDIKPDMAEILLMSADPQISPDEKIYAAEKEELINITIGLRLQTLYSAIESCCPISICSTLHHIHQWKLKFTEESKVYFDCVIKNITYSIVNERKFRVRAELQISAEVYTKKKFSFFRGIEESGLQTMSHEKNIEVLLMTKKDELTVEHEIVLSESNGMIDEILKDDYYVIENYRQIMKDKIVINGFIIAKFLCRGKALSDDPENISGTISPYTLYTFDEKIEFTQFIPIEKKARRDSISKSQAKYTLDSMSSQIATDEDTHQKIISMKGRVKTRIDLFDCACENIVCDAYDLNSELEYSIDKQKLYSLKATVTSDISLRSIFSVGEKDVIKNIIYCQCTHITSNAAGSAIAGNSNSIDAGSLIHGEADFTVLWEDTAGKINHNRFTLPFNTAVDCEFSIRDYEYVIEKVLKSLKCDRASEHQLEINALLTLSVKLIDIETLELITEPRFIKGARGKEYPIAMIRKKDGETLWDLAKKHHTTVESICLANDINKEEGDTITNRLLIAK